MRRLAIPITLTLTFLASRAHSQEDTFETAADSAPATAPAHAVELTVGWGYTQGFGEVSDGEGSIEDEAASGTALSVGLGYRLDPTWMIGGLTAATVVTLVLVPVLYAIFVLDLKLVKWHAPKALSVT